MKNCLTTRRTPNTGFYQDPAFPKTRGFLNMCLFQGLQDPAFPKTWGFWTYAFSRDFKTLHSQRLGIFKHIPFPGTSRPCMPRDSGFFKHSPFPETSRPCIIEHGVPRETNNRSGRHVPKPTPRHHLPRSRRSRPHTRCWDQPCHLRPSSFPWQKSF